jgi:hypothetical protein
MEKKYRLEADRLRRFIYSQYKTVDDCASDIGVSGDSLRSAYLSGKSIMGGEMLRRFYLHGGLDPKYYLSGAGIPPKPTNEEIEEWIEQLNRELKFYTDLLDKRVKALDEIDRNMKRVMITQNKRAGKG